MKLKSKWLCAAVFGALFLVLLLLVKKADVAAIGPNGTSVGLSHLNQGVRQLLGEHLFLYDLTEWLGIAAIFIAVCFALAGCWQLVQRRSVLKVDRGILALGALYVVLAVLYLFFEKFIVNYRPTILPGEAQPEASFPSSHTMLFCVILGSGWMLAKAYVKDPAARRLMEAVCVALIALAVILRLVSGVHWFTDILGGALISAALLSAFAGVLEKINKE